MASKINIVAAEGQLDDKNTGIRVGEAKWKVVKRLIDAYEVANMKKKVKQ